MFVKAQELQAKLRTGGSAALPNPSREAVLPQCQEKVTHYKTSLRPFVPAVATRGQCKTRHGDEDAASSRAEASWGSLSRRERRERRNNCWMITHTHAQSTGPSAVGCVTKTG